MKKHFLLKLLGTIMILAIALTAFAACDDVNVEVTFIVDDEVYEVVNLQDGDTVEMPEDPKKEDCVFGGWYLDKDIWKKPFLGKIEDTTIVKLEVYARWSDTPCEHIWSPWREGIPATCHSVGKKGRSCLRCGKAEATDIEMLEHNFVDGVCINEGCNATDPNYTGLVFILNSDKESYSVEYQGACTETEIVIPAEYRSKPVTTIGTFYGCNSLINIVIPESITDICISSFDGCDNLQFNEYDNGLYLGNDDNPYVAFLTLKEQFITSKEQSITSCEINNKTKVIGIGAFDHYEGVDYGMNVCYKLTSVTIPDSVTHIGAMAFFHCEHLFSVTISDDSLLTSIGVGAFACCYDLRRITLPNGVTSIGDCAFENCEYLVDINIPNSVTYIGAEVFTGCSHLKRIAIPSSVTHIGGFTFADCRELEEIIVAEDNTKYHSKNNCLIETESKILISGCKNSIIPDDGSITSIGDWAFYGCSSLTSVTIPDGVTSIGDEAFYRCSGLTSITIPDSVTSIGDEAFYWCSGLTEIKFSGTKEQWNAITKGNDWNGYVLAEKVVCTDGEVEL